MPRSVSAIHVHKFGGASLADADAVRSAVEIIVAQRAATPRRAGTVVVVSAMAGVTDVLLDLARTAASGDGSRTESTVQSLRRRYTEAVRALVPAGDERKVLLRLIDASFRELEELTHGILALRELTPRTTDYVVARGERLSARVVAAALAAAGCRAEYVDAVDVVQTDGRFGGAFPDLAATDQNARALLTPLLARGAIPVLPGYIGAAANGQVATLGRGGSDLTATLLGRALGADEISLWKDVPGLLTADPKVVPDARVIPTLNLREAAELAYYGARVLHPRALIPVAERRVPIRVRPFADPSAAGTEISARRTLERYPVKALSAIGSQALVTVTGNGMLGVPGIAARAFGAMHEAGISVSLISQASSEHSICFSIPDAHADDARAKLLAAFGTEIARREIDGVQVQPGVATVAVVGLGMAGTPGISARVFSALAEGAVNVIAIAQGSSELNISVVVDAAASGAAQRLIHGAFQLSKIGGGAVAQAARTDVVLLGFGQIGRALGAMLVRRRRELRALRVVAVVDRSGFVFDPEGLAPARLRALAAAKAEGVRLAETEGGAAATEREALAAIGRHALSHPVILDLTAHETTPVLMQALKLGMDLVLANKRPLSGPKQQADELRETAERAGRRLLHETTVGAGLPIIDTYNKLIEAGDRVHQIEASPSGTLGFLLAEIGKGRRFSESLRRAMSLGYTEPDPRDDLSGADVARKALILGRLLGYRGELADVAVESLVPAAVRDVPLAEFLARLEALDGDWEARAREAREAGRVLRYVALVSRRRVAVGLRAYEASSPFAALKGTDNQFVFTTARYKENPLVITGPGAGPAVTAAGVLNDLLKLAGSP